jgi:hypothetical protein
MTTHAVSVFAGVVTVLCLIVFEPLANAGGAPKELQIQSTNPFATDPFDPALNWRLSEDAESLILNRFGPPLHKDVRDVWSRNPLIDMEESTLLYADVRFVLGGQKGSKKKRIRRIDVFGRALTLKHSIRIGMSPSELRQALDLKHDPNSCPSPIMINADYEEYDAARDFSNRTQSVFEAHSGLGTIQYMRWEFLQD